MRCKANCAGSEPEVLFSVHSVHPLVAGTNTTCMMIIHVLTSSLLTFTDETRTTTMPNLEILIQAAQYVEENDCKYNIFV